MTHTVYFFLIMIALYVGAFLMDTWHRHTAGRPLLAAGALLNAVFLIDHAAVPGVFVWNALVDQSFFIPLVLALLILLLPGRKSMSFRTRSLASRPW
jgi:hypothetical protein